MHLVNTRSKIVHVVGKLRRVFRNEWGVRKKAMRVLYKGLFEACVLYGASVWSGVLRFGYGRMLLERCQRVGLYVCVRVCRTVSTEAMQVLMGAIPWDLQCRRRAIMCRWRNGVSVGMNVCVTDEELNGKTLAECARMLDERLYDEWQNRWDESQNGRVTYKYIRDVKFAWRNNDFDPSMYVCFMMTGHGSMNAYLNERGLSETDLCVCGEREDWEHVLCFCRMYGDVRNLGECGVSLGVDGCVDVSGVIGSKASYESFCVTVKRMFEMRRMNVNSMDD